MWMISPCSPCASSRAASRNRMAVLLHLFARSRTEVRSLRSSAQRLALGLEKPPYAVWPRNRWRCCCATSLGHVRKYAPFAPRHRALPSVPRRRPITRQFWDRCRFLEFLLFLLVRFSTRWHEGFCIPPIRVRQFGDKPCMPCNRINSRRISFRKQPRS